MGEIEQRMTIFYDITVGRDWHHTSTSRQDAAKWLRMNKEWVARIGHRSITIKPHFRITHWQVPT